MDEDVLTNDQTEKVLHFQELTGIEDINVVRDILIRHQWNLEIAFQERERMNEGSPSLYASNVEQRAPAVINDRFLQHIFVSSRSNNNNGDAGSGMFGIFSYVVNSILNWCMSTASIFVQTLFSIFTERERSKLTIFKILNRKILSWQVSNSRFLIILLNFHFRVITTSNICF